MSEPEEPSPVEQAAFRFRKADKQQLWQDVTAPGGVCWTVWTHKGGFAGPDGFDYWPISEYETEETGTGSLAIADRHLGIPVRVYPQREWHGLWLARKQGDGSWIEVLPGQSKTTFR